MNNYKYISLSRSKERFQVDNEERYYQHYKIKKNGNENEEKRKQLEREKIIENLKEQKKVREKEWDKERHNYLQRENDLLREINRMKYQENIYNQDIINKSGFKNYQYPKDYKPNNQFQSKFSSYDRTSYFNDNQRNKYQFFSPYNLERNLTNKRENISFYDVKKFENNTSELDKLMSNFKKENNDEPKKDKFKKKIILPKNQGINLEGLLIGPKGIFQRLLEKQCGCKI